MGFTPGLEQGRVGYVEAETVRVIIFYIIIIIFYYYFFDYFYFYLYCLEN